jgi:hypothetical protein
MVKHGPLEWTFLLSGTEPGNGIRSPVRLESPTYAVTIIFRE